MLFCSSLQIFLTCVITSAKVAAVHTTPSSLPSDLMSHPSVRGILPSLFSANSTAWVVQRGKLVGGRSYRSSTFSTVCKASVVSFNLANASSTSVLISHIWSCTLCSFSMTRQIGLNTSSRRSSSRAKSQLDIKWNWLLIKENSGNNSCL